MSSAFKAFIYDVMKDRHIWQEYTRESLLDILVARTIGRLYAPVRQHVDYPVMADRMVMCGLTEAEHVAITQTWREWWTDHGESVLLASAT